MKNAVVLPRSVLWILIAGIMAIVFYCAYMLWGGYKLFTDTRLPSPMATSTSELFQISIQYPRTWSAFELEQGNHGDEEVIAVISGGGPLVAASVEIARKSFPRPTIEDVAAWGLTRLEARTGAYETINLRAASAPNATSPIRRYSRTVQTLLGSETSECMDSYAFTKSHGYALSFCSDDGYWNQVNGVFLEMAESFRAE